jgi:RNA polymerase sigma-70 factor (ECF subfamily)
MENQMMKTRELVVGAQGGDAEAKNELFDRYAPRVLKIVRLRMGPRLRRRMESRDLLQATFEKAVRRFNVFEMRNEASLINWLAKLAERTISEAVKREGSIKRNPDREVPLQDQRSLTSTRSLELDLQAPPAVPLDKVIRDEEEELVEGCLEELPERYRELILLRNFTGLSFEEIGKETGRPSEGATRMMHAKAMRELVARVREKLVRRGRSDEGGQRRE